MEDDGSRRLRQLLLPAEITRSPGRGLTAKITAMWMWPLQLIT